MRGGILEQDRANLAYKIGFHSPVAKERRRKRIEWLRSRRPAVPARPVGPWFEAAGAEPARVEVTEPGLEEEVIEVRPDPPYLAGGISPISRPNPGGGSRGGAEGRASRRPAAVAASSDEGRVMTTGRLTVCLGCSRRGEGVAEGVDVLVGLARRSRRRIPSAIIDGGSTTGSRSLATADCGSSRRRASRSSPRRVAAKLADEEEV